MESKVQPKGVRTETPLECRSTAAEHTRKVARETRSRCRVSSDMNEPVSHSFCSLMHVRLLFVFLVSLVVGSYTTGGSLGIINVTRKSTFSIIILILDRGANFLNATWDLLWLIRT